MQCLRSVCSVLSHFYLNIAFARSPCVPCMPTLSLKLLIVRIDFTFDVDEEEYGTDAASAGSCVRFVASAPGVPAHAFTDTPELPWFPYFDSEDPIKFDLEVCLLK